MIKHGIQSLIQIYSQTALISYEDVSFSFEFDSF